PRDDILRRAGRVVLEHKAVAETGVAVCVAGAVRRDRGVEVERLQCKKDAVYRQSRRRRDRINFIPADSRPGRPDPNGLLRPEGKRVLATRIDRQDGLTRAGVARCELWGFVAAAG